MLVVVHSELREPPRSTAKTKRFVARLEARGIHNALVFFNAPELSDDSPFGGTTSRFRGTVRILIDDQGIGLRDAGALLGLSYERVRQLHSSEAAGVAPRPGGTVVPIVSSDEL